MTAPSDLDALRARLAGLSGRALWHCLDEAADTPAFHRLLRAEYPSLGAAARGPNRRRFLTLLAASFALGGLTGTGHAEGEADERDRIVPYVRQPTDVVPSAPMTYSSAVIFDGLANGAYVTTRNGRPVKIEGNPEHPWSRGGTDPFGQASVLGLYDPDRSQVVRRLDRASDWPTFVATITGHMTALRARGGEGLRLLTPPISAPSLLKQIAAMQQTLPAMQWHSHVPAGRDLLYEGTRRAFGRPLETRWRFDRARVVVAIDGDFLDFGPHQVGVARAWEDARRKAAGENRLLALHAAGATPSLTSAKADFPAVVPASAIPALIAALDQVATGGAASADAPAAAWVQRAGQALRAAHGAGIVTIGTWQPPALQEAVHRLNARLGNLGQTVFYTVPSLTSGAGVAALADDMRDGKVRAVIMLDTNPVYGTPAALGFADALARVPLKLHAGSHVDETAIRADWHLPLKHPLESWGDPRTLDGTVTLLQPTIRPLYDGRTVSEILSVLTEPTPRDDRTLLRAAWDADDAQWQNWLLAGFMPDTAFSAETVSPEAAAPAPAAAVVTTEMRVLIRPDPTVWDGAPANSGWLQELPKPLTKLTWENVIAVSRQVAAREKLANGDIAVLEAGGRTVQGPVWVLPGQADDAVTITLGYGRRAGGAVADGLGFDSYQLLPREPTGLGTWEVDGVTLRRADERRELATTQEHHAIDGNDLVRVQAIGAAAVGDETAFTQPDFYPKLETDGRSWGMAIDLDSCIGCNACVVACQAENNIPVVGREQVLLGRDMHWLRVDSYDDGGLEDPRTRFMPVPCMHCENAPCELGCPVEATLHDHEGLNLQVYNRCIGTRACSSYCPYKVRHFNYLDYTADTAPSVEAQRNPDVTVRARGVMEKCTYCVQRIVAARIASDRDNRPIAEGEVQTACQQACPTRAISFGDMARAESAVSAAKRDARNYALLGELNTRPHTTYLAALAPPRDGDATDR